jgi:hypothetical protein
LIEVSERTGWTYDQILEQPDWYIRAMFEKWKAEALRAKME